MPEAYNAILNRLPELGAEECESLAETIAILLDEFYDFQYPLGQLEYWHDDEIPEKWGEKLCKDLSTLEWEEAASLLDEIEKFLD